MALKYIVTQDKDGVEEIFVFPKKYNHDDMADTVCHLKTYNPHNHREWEREYKKPVSAGFIDGMKCHGRSETLNLDSRGERDTLLLRS